MCRRFAASALFIHARPSSEQHNNVNPSLFLALSIIHSVRPFERSVDFCFSLCSCLLVIRKPKSIHLSLSINYSLFYQFILSFSFSRSISFFSSSSDPAYLAVSLWHSRSWSSICFLFVVFVCVFLRLLSLSRLWLRLVCPLVPCFRPFHFLSLLFFF